MKTRKAVGLFISTLLHSAILWSLVVAHTYTAPKKHPSSVINFTVTKPPPKKKEKPKIVKKKKKRAPISHKREKPKKIEEVKPVFGVTKKSVAKTPSKNAPIMRIGNTLMKEQEKKFTPPAEVKDYASGTKIVEREKGFSPIPLIDLSVMPKPISPTDPDYPKELEDEEIEGEVLLRISVDKRGKVVAIKVLSSDHALFSQSATKTVKQYKFIPGKDKKGNAVAVNVELAIVFELPL
jgi:TonB family protein